MSYIVKGADLPYSCTGCPFVISENMSERLDKDSLKMTRIYNCMYRPDEIEDGWIRFLEADKGRQEWCVLSEIDD